MSGLGNKEIMASNIQYYMSISRKSRKEVCDAIGVKYTTFTDWIKGNTYPRIDKIELMANYFGIAKSDLVEERAHSQNNHFLTNNEWTIIEKFRSLDDRGKNNVLELLDREFSYTEEAKKGSDAKDLA